MEIGYTLEIILIHHRIFHMKLMKPVLNGIRNFDSIRPHCSNTHSHSNSNSFNAKTNFLLETILYTVGIENIDVCEYIDIKKYMK